MNVVELVRRAWFAGIIAVLVGMVLPCAAQEEPQPFCANDREDRPFVANACALAQALGEAGPLAKPLGSGFTIRVFVSRPFKQPSVIRVDVRSMTEGSITLRSFAETKVDRTTALSPDEISLLAKYLQDSKLNFSDAACGQGVILAEQFAATSYQAGTICTNEAGRRFPVGAAIDEIMRNRLGFKG